MDRLRKAGGRGQLAAAFLAGLALVLHHRTRASDIRIGMMISNRSRPDAEHLIGYFVNTAVIRLSVRGDHTAGELLGAAGEAVGEALDNQEVPIQDVRRELGEAGLPDDAPLYQVTVALNTMRTSSLTLDGLTCQDLDTEVMDTRLAPTSIEQRWVLEDRAGALEGTLTYQTTTFTQAEIRAVVDDLDRALAGITAPERSVAQIIACFQGGPTNEWVL